MKILLTGSCGFIGSNFVRYVLHNHSDIKLIGIDNLDEKCNIDNIYHHRNYNLHIGDFTNVHFVDRIFDIEKPDVVIHMGAKSFVCSSLDDPTPFYHSNVVGTQVLVNASVKYKVKKFFYISTDESFGQLSDDDLPWTEESVKLARNPYATSKLAGELAVKSTNETFGLPYLISYGCNNFGIFQNIRNLIPKTISNILHNQPMTIFGEGKEKREFIYVIDKVKAILTILEKSPDNESYNIGTGYESSNLQTVNTIYKTMNIEPNIVFTENRKCSDYRYALNCEKLHKLGWQPKVSFEEGLSKTIEWYKKNLNYCR